MKEYTIKAGDSFFRIAQQNGCCWQDLVNLNPGLNPYQLQSGQKIKIPVKNSQKSADGMITNGNSNHYHRCDDVLVEVEGVKFRVTRLGEPTIPHENHLVLPRTEIRKVEHIGTGIIETNIMISNINIVNSPRFEGEKYSKKDLPEIEKTEDNFNF